MIQTTGRHHIKPTLIVWNPSTDAITRHFLPVNIKLTLKHLCRQSLRTIRSESIPLRYVTTAAATSLVVATASNLILVTIPLLVLVVHGVNEGSSGRVGAMEKVGFRFSAMTNLLSIRLSQLFIEGF